MKKIKTTIYLDHKVYRDLIKLSSRTHVPMAEYLRQAAVEVLEREKQKQEILRNAKQTKSIF